VQARRLGRRFGPLHRGRHSLRPWWQTHHLEFVTLESNGLPEEYEGFERVRIGRALVYRGEVELDPLDVRRRLAVIFPGPPSRVSPIVMASGPRRSRHRFTRTFRPTSLCIWYAPDHPELRWHLQDGLALLIDLARVHLIREAWWRETRHWDGPEVHRDPNPNLSVSRTARLRHERRKCWCGTGHRYTGCHGAMSNDDELVLLGLVEGHPPPAATRHAA
jgi:hypothetical protein